MARKRDSKRKVIYLKPGEKPNPRSRHIQVYEEEPADRVAFSKLEADSLHWGRDWLSEGALLEAGNGADAYTLSAEDLARLRAGETLALSSQGEYTVYLRCEKCDPLEQ